MHGFVKYVFVVIGLLVLAQLLFILLFVGPNGDGGAMVQAEQAVELAIANDYDMYCYGVNAYRTADLDSNGFDAGNSTDNPNTIVDIYESQLPSVTWQSAE